MGMRKLTPFQARLDELGLSVADLARERGVSWPTAKRWVSGKRMPTAEDILWIETRFGVTAIELVEANAAYRNCFANQSPIKPEAPTRA